jgi:hypothetical protein
MEATISYPSNGLRIQIVLLPVSLTSSGQTEPDTLTHRIFMPYVFNPFTNRLDFYAASAGGTVTSVSGTANRITVTNPTTTPVIDIASTYVGQTSITTLGTITTGVWNGTAVGATHGGTSQSSWTTGDLLYASGTNTLAKLPIGSATNVLTVSGGLPSWQAGGGGTKASFLALLTSTQSNVTGDTTLFPVVFDTLAFQLGGSNYNTSTGVFTAPNTGKYQFDVLLNINAATASANYLLGASTAYPSIYFTFGETLTGTATLNGSITIPMTAGDTFSMNLQGAASTKTTSVTGSTNPITWLSCNQIA